MAEAQAAFKPLESREAVAFVGSAAPDVSALPATHSGVAACAQAVRSMGRASAIAEATRKDIREIYASLTVAAAAPEEATRALADMEASLARLPSDVRGPLEASGSEWAWESASLGERRAFVAGVMEHMENPSVASDRYGAHDTRAAPDAASGHGTVGQPLSAHGGVSMSDIMAARAGSGRSFDSSLGAAGRRDQRAGMSVEEAEAADRAEAAATIRLDVPGVSTAVTTEGFTEPLARPASEGAFLQARAVRQALAYAAEWIVNAGGETTLGKPLFDRIVAKYVPQGPGALSLSAIAADVPAAARRGGAIGWGLDQGAAQLDDSAVAAFRASPAPPASAAAHVLIALRRDIHDASTGSEAAARRLGLAQADLAQVAEWRASIERLAASPFAKDAPAVSWISTLPGGPAFARADLSFADSAAAAAADSAASAASADHVSLAALSGPHEGIPAGAITSGGTLGNAAISATIAAAAGRNNADGGLIAPSVYAQAAEQAMATGSRAGLHALVDAALRRCGAGSVFVAAARLNATYGPGPWAEQLASLAAIYGARPSVSDPPSRLSPDALTLGGLLPASAASPAEFVEVATEGRIGTAKDLARRVGATTASITADSVARAARNRGEAGHRAAVALTRLAPLVDAVADAVAKLGSDRAAGTDPLAARDWVEATDALEAALAAHAEVAAELRVFAALQDYEDAVAMGTAGDATPESVAAAAVAAADANSVPSLAAADWAAIARSAAIVSDAAAAGVAVASSTSAAEALASAAASTAAAAAAAHDAIVAAPFGSILGDAFTGQSLLARAASVTVRFAALAKPEELAAAASATAGSGPVAAALTGGPDAIAAAAQATAPAVAAVLHRWATDRFGQRPDAAGLNTPPKQRSKKDAAAEADLFAGYVDQLGDDDAAFLALERSRLAAEAKRRLAWLGQRSVFEPAMPAGQRAGTDEEHRLRELTAAPSRFEALAAARGIAEGVMPKSGSASALRSVWRRLDTWASDDFFTSSPGMDVTREEVRALADEAATAFAVQVKTLAAEVLAAIDEGDADAEYMAFDHIGVARQAHKAAPAATDAAVLARIRAAAELSSGPSEAAVMEAARAAAGGAADAAPVAEGPYAAAAAAVKLSLPHAAELAPEEASRFVALVAIAEQVRAVRAEHFEAPEEADAALDSLQPAIAEAATKLASALATAANASAAAALDDAAWSSGDRKAAARTALEALAGVRAAVNGRSYSAALAAGTGESFSFIAGAAEPAAPAAAPLKGAAAVEGPSAADMARLCELAGFGALATSDRWELSCVGKDLSAVPEWRRLRIERELALRLGGFDSWYGPLAWESIVPGDTSLLAQAEATARL
ncbi:hypothetical protein FNF28_05881 [Cafeteria roenbergensis]|uniref:Uncharacterized protein n=2 Tax=Cafeteria roenbergensis TaxID=33653 RepID=A0A5A8D564_CAFRO|nr:hypothetical protein FNF28_05881 [Cafeteria roenbergensis]